jgi:hypothetical protein
VTSLVDRRCWHHPAREAVVRCPECRRFYCRECATEHAGRMMCAGCVARLAGGPGVRRHRLRGVLWSASALGGLLLAWLLFYYLGVMLARIPSDFFGGPA